MLLRGSCTSWLTACPFARYGFEHVYIPQDILAWNDSVWPFHKLSDKEKTFARVS